MDSRMRRTPPGVTQLDMMGGCLNAARAWVRVAPAEVGTRGSNTSIHRNSVIYGRFSLFLFFITCALDKKR